MQPRFIEIGRGGPRPISGHTMKQCEDARCNSGRRTRSVCLATVPSPRYSVEKEVCRVVLEIKLEKLPRWVHNDGNVFPELDELRSISGCDQARGQQRRAGPVCAPNRVHWSRRSEYGKCNPLGGRSRSEWSSAGSHTEPCGVPNKAA